MKYRVKIFFYDGTYIYTDCACANLFFMRRKIKKYLKSRIVKEFTIIKKDGDNQ